MKIGLNLSNDELKEMAERQNKSIEEVANDYKHALKELEYSNKKLNKIIRDFKYTKFPNNIRLEVSPLSETNFHFLRFVDKLNSRAKF